MEKGTCSWCTKPGVIYYIPVEADFKDHSTNRCVEELNARVLSHKLIKIAKGVFACKECVTAYNLRPAE